MATFLPISLHVDFYIFSSINQVKFGILDNGGVHVIGWERVKPNMTTITRLGKNGPR